MSIPKYRYVRYEDDGVARWQCLSCYADVHTPEDLCYWAYCPHCGIKWDGRNECRTSSTPRWAYERAVDYDPWIAHTRCTKLWVIEYRYTGKPEPSHRYGGRMGEPRWSPWLQYAKQGPRTMTAARVKEILERYRSDEHERDCKCEFRAKIVPYDEARVHKYFY